jgi:Mor family transcriptional regulator
MVMSKTRQTANSGKTAPPPADLSAALAAVEHTDDVVEYTLRVVMAMVPGFSAAAREAAERHVRELFGGSQVYVPRRAGDGRALRNDAIRRDYRSGERIGLLARRYHLSPAQIWRIVNGV